MKQVVGRWLFWAATAGLAALGGGGCVEDQSMLFVRQAQARVASGATGCTVESSPSSLFITEGTLDLAFRTEYTAALLVGNQLVARGNSSQLRTETSRVQIEGAEVKLEDGATVVWGPFTVPGSGFVDPATGATPSFGLTETILIGSAYGNQLIKNFDKTVVKRLTSVVKINGKTLGGSEIQSNEWRFPLSVCYGCLIVYPPDANDPKLAQQPNCGLPAGTGTTVTPPCVLGQDDAIDCRLCKTSIRPQDMALCEPSF
jgi:hypothetical protein